MRWEDERYVRLYTRDSADWLMLSFEAQGLLALLLRKADRAGIIDLGRHGKRSIAILLGHAHRWDAIEPALEELLSDGVIELRGDLLVFRNYIEAQGVAQSDRVRKEESRARARDIARAQSRSVTKSHDSSQPVTQDAESGQAVTKRDHESQNVTKSHDSSQPVTDGHSMLCCTVPSCTDCTPDGAPDGARPDLVLVEQKPKAAKKLSLQQEFWAWAQRIRQEDGLLPDVQWSIPQINARLASITGHSRQLIADAYLEFLGDERVKSKGAPMAFFAMDWPRWAEQSERAVRGAP